MKKYLNKIHYSKVNSPLENIFIIFLAIFSLGYYFGINARNLLYKLNILKRVKLQAYTISIGNLTTGGTGKTPLTVALANYIKEKYNKNIAVLSHGYGGKLPVNNVNVISNTENILIDPDLAGDEPYLIASKLVNIPVLTGRNRFNTGKYAIENFGAEILLLDDGFQHVKLERDLNILVIDCNKKFGNGFLLPAGPLREQINQIIRADKIVLVDKNPYSASNEYLTQKYKKYLEDKFNKPVEICKFKQGKIYNIKTLEPLNNVNKGLAFTGIAQPEFFFNYLREQNINLVQTKEFTDHYLYIQNDVKNLTQESLNLGIEALITTEKDAVKLVPIISKIDLQIPIFALQLDLEVDLDNLIGTSLSSFYND